MLPTPLHSISNSPLSRSSFTPLKGTLKQHSIERHQETSDSANTASFPHSCASCKTVLAEGTTFKWCLDCVVHEAKRMQENRDASRRRRAKLRASSSNLSSQHELMQVDPMPKARSTFSTASLVKGNKEGITSVLGKRKLEVDVDPSSSAPPSIPPQTHACQEYQTSADLFAAISYNTKTISFTTRFLEGNTSGSSSIPPPRDKWAFNASYTVIADPTVTRLRRMEMVLREFKKAISLPFRLPGRIEASKGSDLLIKVFPCQCTQGRQAAPSTSPVPTLSATSSSSFFPMQPSASNSKSAEMHTSDMKPKPTLKKTQSTLSNWFVSTGVKGKATAQTSSASTVNIEEKVCTGFVRIAVATDTSHRLGRKLKGQKIIICFEHPDGGTLVP
ncbi:unnamed protein product [Somion occarium]|uniref:Uncharacterized protein n=1 Tax=Somion occarium TaxID=3059160 RepID=A0ABP1E5D4_9APHY